MTDRLGCFLFALGIRELLLLIQECHGGFRRFDLCTRVTTRGSRNEKRVKASEPNIELYPHETRRHCAQTKAAMHSFDAALNQLLTGKESELCADLCATAGRAGAVN